MRVSKCRLTAKTQKEKQKVASASKNSTIVLRNPRALPVRVCSPTADENMEPQADFTIVPYSKAKAAIWKHFGVRKRKADGSIVENVAICLTCQSAIKTGGGTSNFHKPHQKTPPIPAVYLWHIYGWNIKCKRTSTTPTASTNSCWCIRSSSKED